MNGPSLRSRLEAKATAVHDELRKSGASDLMIRDLIDFTSKILVYWKQYSRETMPKRRRRFERMRKKISALAKEIERDPEWSKHQIDIYYDKHVHHKPVHKILEELANEVASQCDAVERFDRKRSIESFALYEIYCVLIEHFPPSQKKNQQTEVLASAVLNKEIDPGTLAQVKKYVKQ